MSDTVVLSENILDIALWVKKSKMAAICSRSSGKFISFSKLYRQIRIFGIHHEVF